MGKCVVNHGFDFGVLNWSAMGGQGPKSILAIFLLSLLLLLNLE